MSVLIGCVSFIFCASLEGSNHRNGKRTVGSSEGSRAEDGKFVDHSAGEPETEGYPNGPEEDKATTRDA